MYNSCIYTKIYCGYFWGACIVATEMLVEAMAVPVVAVAVADGAAATVSDVGGTGSTVKESGTTGTTVEN